MKKSMLCAGLMTILCATAYAKDSDKPVNTNNKNVKQTTPTLANTKMKQDKGVAVTPAGTSMPTQQEAEIATSDAIQTPTPTGAQTPTTPGVQTPAAPGTQTLTSPDVQTPVDPGAKTPAPGAPTPAASGATTPAASGATTPAASGAQAPVAPAKPPQPLNCTYRIPAETTHIEQTIVMKWAEKAAEQSFDFDHNMIDKQLLALKSCYTDQGWQGFNDALQKSGNLNAIKSQKLLVSSMVNGEGKVIEIKDNQWKVTVPMQVVYQNDKEKLTQPLTVNLVVGRKISGDLGIMQMIAIPRQANTTSNAIDASPAATPPATITTNPSPATPAAPSKP